MSNDTTTDEHVDEQPLEEGQADETIEQSAESLRSEAQAEDNTQEPEAEEETEAEDNSEAEVTDDLKEWAKKKGIDPSDTDAVLKLARDTEKGFRQYSEKAKAETNELKQKIAENPDNNETDAVIQEARVINFYNSKPEARQYDQKMGEIYGRFQKSDPDFAQHLLRHLDTLYAMARAEDSSVEVQKARQEGKAEAIKATKKAQASSTPKVNATSSAPENNEWNEERVSKVIQEGNYDKYRDEILAWERSQY